MTTTEAPVARGRRTAPLTDTALIAAFAALISAVTYLGALPVGIAGVPITLQTFAVVLAGLLLGPVRGALAALLYLGLGAIGLPVFAGHVGGVGLLAGATAGYLWSYPPAAAVAGLVTVLLARRVSSRPALLLAWLVAAGIAASLLAIYPLGVTWLKVYLDMSWGAALTGGMVPYLPGDLVKIVVAALVAAPVHRAFPQLLLARR